MLFIISKIYVLIVCFFHDAGLFKVFIINFDFKYTK